MTSKEDLERLTNDIMEQSKTICNNPLSISMIINAEYFMPILENAIKDLERLEALEKENKDLKHLEIANLKHSIDEKNEIISDLKLENETYIEESTKVIEQYKQLQQKNKKLKEAVTMLYLVAKLYDFEVYDNLDEKDKNLLKEVLCE